MANGRPSPAPARCWRCKKRWTAIPRRRNPTCVRSSPERNHYPASEILIDALDMFWETSRAFGGAMRKRKNTIVAVSPCIAPAQWRCPKPGCGME